MARYIDADKLQAMLYHKAFEEDSDLQRWDSGCWIRYKMFENVMEQTPTADVVEVVRCKDCKHSRSDEFEPLWCYLSETCDPVKEDHFCGYGERRDE